MDPSLAASCVPQAAGWASLGLLGDADAQAPAPHFAEPQSAVKYAPQMISMATDV